MCPGSFRTASFSETPAGLQPGGSMVQQTLLTGGCCFHLAGSLEPRLMERAFIVHCLQASLTTVGSSGLRVPEE